MINHGYPNEISENEAGVYSKTAKHKFRFDNPADLDAEDAANTPSNGSSYLLNVSNDHSERPIAKKKTQLQGDHAGSDEANNDACFSPD